MGTAPAYAEDPWRPPPHVRPQTADARTLVADATARSPAVRAMLDRLEGSDVIVYIRHRMFVGSELQGWIGMLSAVAGRRYLVIELACGRSWADQIGTLGHELHHAIEIAGEPSIVDAQSLAAYYERIGERTGGLAPSRTYETAGARRTGLQVRREALMKPARVDDEHDKK